MILISDKGQQKGKHAEKEAYWKRLGIEVREYPLPYGDYILADDKVLDMINRRERDGLPITKSDFSGLYTVSVDTKKDIPELAKNICGGGKEHIRFREECIKARDRNCKLYILVQNVGGLIKGTKDIYNPTITRLEDLHKWRNPRLFEMKRTDEIIGYYRSSGNPIYKRVQKYPTATRGEKLMKACKTMQKKYGVEFIFCSNSEQGAKVIELLQREVE